MIPHPDAAPPQVLDPIVTEDDAAQLVRDVLGLDDIVAGSILFFLCDARRRPVTPVLITDVPATAPADLVLSRWFGHLGSMLGEHGSSIVFARARPGQSFVLDHDRAWHEAVVAGCVESDIPLLAAFVVTSHAVIPFQAPLAAATSDGEVAVARGEAADRDGPPLGQAE